MSESSEARWSNESYSGGGVAVVPGVVRVPGWEQMQWLRHGFSTRTGGVSTIYRSDRSQAAAASQAVSEELAAGDLNLGWTPDDSADLVAENRRRFTDAVWREGSAQHGPLLITVRQVHGAVGLVVRDRASAAAMVSEAGRALCEADGLITAAPGLLLGVQTADCVPVMVVDPVRRVVAAFHAGWRGTVARIVEQGVATMQAEFGCRSEDLLAAVGPSIGACCYSVGAEVLGAFHASFEYAEALFQAVNEAGHDSQSGLQLLDLWEANRRQLLAGGVDAKRITVLAECTACAGLPAARRYFSHRAERGFTGRMLNVVGIAAASPAQ